MKLFDVVSFVCIVSSATICILSVCWGKSIDENIAAFSIQCLIMNAWIDISEKIENLNKK